MFHEYFVQISAVYAYMSGYIRDPDIIAVVVFHVFFGLTGNIRQNSLCFFPEKGPA